MTVGLLLPFLEEALFYLMPLRTWFSWLFSRLIDSGEERGLIANLLPELFRELLLSVRRLRVDRTEVSLDL